MSVSWILDRNRNYTDSGHGNSQNSDALSTYRVIDEQIQDWSWSYIGNFSLRLGLVMFYNVGLGRAK